MSGLIATLTCGACCRTRLTRCLQCQIGHSFCRAAFDTASRSMNKRRMFSGRRSRSVVERTAGSRPAVRDDIAFEWVVQA
jgi:hypothetical protein